MELYELIEKYRDQERMHCMEGSSGVQHLCDILGAIGYTDSGHRFGNYGRANLGNLINFLEDNSGAIEAILEWAANINAPEWKEALESELPEEESE